MASPAYTMTVISFSNHKGGTGKTTSTVNIACALRDKKKKVLVIDLDPQGNLSYSLGITDFTYTSADWLEGKISTDDCAIYTEGIYLLPSSIAVSGVEEKIKLLPHYKHLIKERLADQKYDFVLIDCPPAMGTYTQMALSCSDYVIIPMLMEILSIQGLSQIIKFINGIRLTSNNQLEILGVLAVCVNESRKLTSEVLEFIDATYGVNIFNNRIHNNVKAAEAPSFAKSVIDYAPTSSSSRDYKAVTEEILKKLTFSINPHQVT